MAVAGGWCSGNRNLKIGSSNTNLNSETIKKYFINYILNSSVFNNHVVLKEETKSIGMTIGMNV